MADPKRQPWMKWYPADWRDPRLRLCSLAARGLWADMISYMHEGEPYGHLTVAGVSITTADLASLVGQPQTDVKKALAELEAKSVYSTTDVGVIYSRRMVRDKAKADRDRENGKGGGNPNLPKGDNEGVNPPDNGGDKAQKPEARSQTPPAPTEPAPRARKGTKLSEGWTPLPSDLSYAEGRGFPAPQIADIAANFRDYWTVGSGRNKTHADWGKAWQSWIRKEKPHVAGRRAQAAVLDPDEQVRRRRAQIAGGVAAIRERGRHDPGRAGGDVAGGEAGAGPAFGEDHRGADGRGNGPHGRVGGDIQPPAEGLGQGGGFLHGGAETPAGGLAGRGDGAREIQSPAGDAPAAAARDRGAGRAGTIPTHDAQDQAVPGGTMPGSRSGGDALPGHEARAEGGSGSDAGRLEQQIQLANRELTDQPMFLRRQTQPSEADALAARYAELTRRTA